MNIERFPLNAAPDRATQPPHVPLSTQLSDCARALELRDEFITSRQWWNERLEGVNTITQELPDILARMTSAALAMKKASPQGADILAWGIANEFARFVRNIAQKDAQAEAEAIVERGE